MYDHLEALPAQSELAPVEQEMEQVQEQQVQQPQDGPEERYNDTPDFKSLRKKAYYLAKERDELVQALEQERAKKSSAPDEDFSFNLGDDEIAEGKHLSKIRKEIRNLESKMQQYQQNVYQTATEAKLKSEYPDIESVVSRENIEELAARNPVLARTLDATPDFYNKAVAYYSIIKGMNIGNAAPDPYVKDKQRAQFNNAKPRSSASLSPQSGDSPLSRANAFANGLTPELRKQMWKEMEDSIKNL